MIEIRFHGRGGQGVVTAANILAYAVFKEDKYVQSFPHFGVERRGAPVVAFTRIDTKKIRLRSQIYEPDFVIVLDKFLLNAVNVTEGLKNNSIILINTNKRPDEIKFDINVKVATIDATGIAIKHGLGSRVAPIVNTSILGAFAKVSRVVDISSVVEAVKESAPGKKDENAKATIEAYEKVIFFA